MATTTATELAQFGALVTTDPATSTVTVNGTLTATTITLPNSSVTAAKLANPQYTGFRNRIINGDMRIDQRNAGASVNPANASVTLDRWGSNMFANASKYTVVQSSTAPVGFNSSLLVTSSSSYSVGATDIYTQFQWIEGFNTADLGWGTANAKTVTVSFWVRSSLTGTFGGALFNSDQTRSYPFTYTINSANTFEQKTITIAGDTSGTWLTTNGRGIAVVFGLGVGSTNSGTAGAWASAGYYSATGATSVVGTNGATFYITGVQLEAGSTATDFERRPIGTELALCKRYYYELPSGNTNAFLLQGGMQTGSNALSCIYHPIEMRTAPTLGAAGVASDYYVALNTTTVVCTSLPTIVGMSSKTATALSFAATGTLGYASWPGAATSTAKLSFTSEL